MPSLIQTEAKPDFACNVKAIPATLRPRYLALVERVRRAIMDRKELAHGYRYSLTPGALTPAELGEWMGYERQCCPFLSLTLTLQPGIPGQAVTLSGMKGIKGLLDVEFPVR